MTAGLAFAFGAGLLAPVSPCALSILPAYLSHYLADTDRASTRPTTERLIDGLAGGAAVTAGFAGLYLVVAFGVTVGLRSVLTYVPQAAVAIGVVMLAAGVMVVVGRRLPTPTARQLQPGSRRGTWHLVIFGASYAVAALSCTLAVLLAVVGQALATGNPVEMLAVLAAYAAGSATVLISLSASAAIASGAVARGLRRLAAVSDRLSGALLIAAGAYLLAYWLPVIAGSVPDRRVTGLTVGRR